MILGAHNVLTFGTPKTIWDYFCIPFAKCQSKGIKELFDLNVRCFDIRIRFDKNNVPYACHGLFKVKFNILDLLSLKYCNDIYIRLLLETSKADSRQEENFIKLVQCLRKMFPNIKFIELRRKFDWKRLIEPDCEEPKMIQYVSSMAKDVRWYEKYIPYLYAKRMNKTNLLKKHDDCIVLYDFL